MPPTTDPNVEEIRVLNSENNTNYYQYVRRDRIAAFFRYIMENRQSGLQPSIMPGLSGAAIAGLDAIFERRPLKFPAYDLLLWFRDNQKSYLGEYPNPTITTQEIEKALEEFSKLYPPDVAAREA